MVITKKAKIIASKITEENENDYLGAIRCHYTEEFSSGGSDEALLLWVEGQLDPSLLEE